MSQNFPIKDPAEKVVLTFDFSGDLAAGEILIGSPAITVAAEFGADANPSAIRNGAATLDATATQVLVPVQSGIAGVRYRIKVVAPTSNSAKIVAITGILPVQSG